MTEEEEKKLNNKINDLIDEIKQQAKINGEIASSLWKNRIIIKKK